MPQPPEIEAGFIEYMNEPVDYSFTGQPIKRVDITQGLEFVWAQQAFERGFNLAKQVLASQ